MFVVVAGMTSNWKALTMIQHFSRVCNPAVYVSHFSVITQAQFYCEIFLIEDCE